MPRRARLILPEVPLHVIQRGNNRQICFVTDDDCRFYLDWLSEYAADAGCRIHAYVLMSNHLQPLDSVPRYVKHASPQSMLRRGEEAMKYLHTFALRLAALLPALVLGLALAGSPGGEMRAADWPADAYLLQVDSGS
jgi:putative transposase